MYAGPIIVQIVGTLAVLLIPAVVLVGIWPTRTGKRH